MDSYGYRRNYMPYMEGYGAYNPYMQYPDIGGFAQTFMQNLLAAKQMRTETEQREWAKKQAEWEKQQREYTQDLERQRIDIDRARMRIAAAAEKRLAPQIVPEKIPPELEQFFLTNVGKDWRSGMTREQYDYYRDMWADERRRKQQIDWQKTGKVDPTWAKHFEFVANTLNDYIKDLQLIQETSKDPLMQSMSQADRTMLQDQAANLQRGVEWLKRYQSYLYSSGQSLHPDQLKEISRLNNYRNRIKDKGIFWKTPEETQPTQQDNIKITGTVNESLLPMGTQVYALPDGTEVVNINGQWKKLIKS